MFLLKNVNNSRIYLLKTSAVSLNRLVYRKSLQDLFDCLQEQFRMLPLYLHICQSLYKNHHRRLVFI